MPRHKQYFDNTTSYGQTESLYTDGDSGVPNHVIEKETAQKIIDEAIRRAQSRKANKEDLESIEDFEFDQEGSGKNFSKLKEKAKEYRDKGANVSPIISGPGEAEKHMELAGERAFTNALRSYTYTINGIEYTREVEREVYDPKAKKTVRKTFMYRNRVHGRPIAAARKILSSIVKGQKYNTTLETTIRETADEKEKEKLRKLRRKSIYTGKLPIGIDNAIKIVLTEVTRGVKRRKPVNGSKKYIYEYFAWREEIPVEKRREVHKTGMVRNKDTGKMEEKKITYIPQYRNIVIPAYGLAKATDALQEHKKRIAARNVKPKVQRHIQDLKMKTREERQRLRRYPASPTIRKVKGKK
ncbi:MAG: hypothetical protein ABIN35_00335 [candidate division WOR-3 bacterium]